VKPKPIVHRKPILVTIRELYATAFRCGKPGRGRPSTSSATTPARSFSTAICRTSAHAARVVRDGISGDERRGQTAAPPTYSDVLGTRWRIALHHGLQQSLWGSSMCPDHFTGGGSVGASWIPICRQSWSATLS
jgi:hypothetical protein